MLSGKLFLYKCIFSSRKTGDQFFCPKIAMENTFEKMFENSGSKTKLSWHVFPVSIISFSFSF